MILLAVLAGAAIAQAQDLIRCEQLHGFLGGTNDGEYLNDPVIESGDGRLYGTTINGGAQDGGVVFAMAKDGNGYVILHDFTGSTNDGLSPWGGVIQGYDGRLYGATRHGGTQDAGIVFGLNTNGTGFTIIRSFTTNANDGAYPLNTVIQGTDGRLYGRTISGGTNDGHSIFVLNTNGAGYAVLYSFNSLIPDHDDSYSGLIEGSDGLLYGTTYRDGAHGHGSVFRLHKDGTAFQTLHDFEDSATDGGYPYGGIHETREDVLYGATSYGGPDHYGTLYRINRDGTDYTVLHYFFAINKDAYLPVAAPVEGPGGLLYGTTYFGGSEDGGTVYCVNNNGSGFTILYNFKWSLPEGAEPNAQMIWGSDGAMYGTTFYGGGLVSGSVFRIKPAVLQGRRTGNQFTVRFDGFASQRYDLYAAESLPPKWTKIATVTNATGTVAWSEAMAAAGMRFYRAQVLNP